MRALSAAGNAAFFGFLGAGAFFGYYTVRYNAEELQTVVHETHKPENQFFGSSVCASPADVRNINKCIRGCSSDCNTFVVGLGSSHGVVPGEPYAP